MQITGSKNVSTTDNLANAIFEAGTLVAQYVEGTEAEAKDPTWKRTANDAKAVIMEEARAAVENVTL